jgi:short subunit dehydrogenase
MTPDGKPTLSRRTLVGGAGVAAAAAAATRLAPSIAKEKQEMTIQEIENPSDKYPKPPFKRQSQPWPGLASRMEPKPDHGETSYKGSGRLAGRKALITGGDSGMGRAAAIAFAREGADVAINYYPDEEPDAQQVIKLIKDAGRNGVAIPGDLRDEVFAPSL